MRMPTIVDLPAPAMDSPEVVGHPGVAAGSRVTSASGAGSWKQIDVEKLSNRYNVATFDFDQDRLFAKKIKQRIEHTEQRILCLEYKEDWRRGTTSENLVFALLMSEWQEVWAADERDTPARWIKAGDLVPGRHVLKLALAHEKGPWAEIVMVEPPKHEKYRDLPVHELVLIEGESAVISHVLCRMACVPAPPIKKRLVYPLKDFPLINFVPQPKTLSLVHAEAWYRKSAALLPCCVGESPEPMARVRTMLELKWRMREAAVKAAIATELRDEFIAKHPLPTLEELVPDYKQLMPEILKSAVEAAVQILSAPGDRHYSEFTGGIESHHVWTGDEYWKFDGDRWVQTTAQGK